MPASKPFRFKQFTISQNRSTHKVGTDGTLLGAWVNVHNANNIVDIGTGTGLIALMLAQRTAPHVQIHAVEIESEDAAEAQDNFIKSPWAKRLKIHHMPVQDFHATTKFDLVISNPPFFINSYLPPEQKRSRARHTQDLTFKELIEACEKLLQPDGRMAIILPDQEGQTFNALAQLSGWFCIRQCAFKSRMHKPVERWLMEFSKAERTCETSELILYEQGEQWSDAYINLTQAFYLKL